MFEGVPPADRYYPSSPAFVFDMMEPERPKVDRAVLAFLRTGRCIPPTSQFARMGW